MLQLRDPKTAMQPERLMDHEGRLGSSTGTFVATEGLTQCNQSRMRSVGRGSELVSEQTEPATFLSEQKSPADFLACDS